MSPHFYYALKYFANQESYKYPPVEHTVDGFILTIKDYLGICRIEHECFRSLQDWIDGKFLTDCGKFTFTYRYKGLHNELEVCDSYTVKRLYEFVSKQGEK